MAQREVTIRNLPRWPRAVRQLIEVALRLGESEAEAASRVLNGRALGVSKTDNPPAAQALYDAIDYQAFAASKLTNNEGAEGGGLVESRGSVS
jgi:hypothetical protein